MRIRRLSLHNFRNYIRLEATFPDGPVLLTGPNAQGKTSLLEAVYLFTHARSPLAENDRQLINFLAWREPQPFARLEAEVEDQAGKTRLELRLFSETIPHSEPRFHKEILVNGLRHKPAELPGIFRALLFLPQELKVVEGAPGDRRRHLDEVLSQADAAYRTALWEYHRVLPQRNALLHTLQESGGDPDQLDYWDEKMAVHGAVIIAARIRALAEWEAPAASTHRRLSHGAETLSLRYHPSIDPAQPWQGEEDVQQTLPLDIPPDRTRFSESDIRGQFREHMLRTRPLSIRRGMTIAGPHRDEFRFLANGIDLTSYGSRGQARTALLSIKLAEVEWMRSRGGEWPVLLLDEVFSELDIRRREDLLESLWAADQVLLTASDAGMLPESFRDRTSTWWVENGTMRKDVE
jgi:DNA replication and repair protein RecF